MMKVAGLLGVLASALSLFLLLHQAFEFGLAVPLTSVARYYDQWVRFLLTPFEPIVASITQVIQQSLHLNLTLHPHWKHILIPMWLYVGAETRATWLMPGVERKIATIVYGAVGLAIGMTASVAVGTIALDQPSPLFVAYPAVGFLLFNLLQTTWNSTFHRYPGNTWAQTFRHYGVSLVLSTLIIGVIAVVLSILLPATEGLNVLLLLALCALLALRNFAVAAWIAWSRTNARPVDGATFSARFQKLPQRQIGLWILASLAGVLIFLILNAGLQFAGL